MTKKPAPTSKIHIGHRASSLTGTHELNKWVIRLPINKRSGAGVVRYLCKWLPVPVTKTLFALICTKFKTLNTVHPSLTTVTHQHSPTPTFKFSTPSRKWPPPPPNTTISEKLLCTTTNDQVPTTFSPFSELFFFKVSYYCQFQCSISPFINDYKLINN